MTTSDLGQALAEHFQATLHLSHVALALEWTILTRFIVGVMVATLLSIVYLVWTLRDSQQPLHVWEKLNKPVIKLFRPKIFAFLLRGVNPYVGSIDIRISTFSKGFCTGIMRDRHKNRNPFNSIHATALATLAETVGELALLSTLAAKDRAILTSLKMEFSKKARGLLTASSDFAPPTMNEESNEANTVVVIKDRVLDTVAVAHLVWNVKRGDQ
ncbi:hypothetical protein DM01DRAFT_1365562 [Hesseltinella vesiculosa]|uniref:DUF4442 domain-containing protein n=1 Tax=Hesseltinella vesiculosa TaxID=101127 RepID=A0A1X2GTL3_9FUNG|nr:hypothetical protein DM01DRAFT_1365562 [Hesseltinella vesiculosa]